MYCSDIVGSGSIGFRTDACIAVTLLGVVASGLGRTRVLQ